MKARFSFRLLVSVSAAVLFLLCFSAPSFAASKVLINAKRPSPEPVDPRIWAYDPNWYYESGTWRVEDYSTVFGSGYPKLLVSTGDGNPGNGTPRARYSIGLLSRNRTITLTVVSARYWSCGDMRIRIDYRRSDTDPWVTRYYWDVSLNSTTTQWSQVVLSNVTYKIEDQGLYSIVVECLETGGPSGYPDWVDFVNIEYIDYSVT